LALLLEQYTLTSRRPPGGGYRMRRFPRTPPRLSRVIPNNPVFFVTACTYRRRPILATKPVASALGEFAERAYSKHNIAMGRYVIMPNHIHLFVCGPDDFELGRWMGILKRYVAKSVMRTPSADPVWQRRFFDHVLRSDDSYAEKWNYVRENPVRAGLVTKADDWPYAGEMIRIDRI
jgi:REP element-mobilizing transposase RayT